MSDLECVDCGTELGWGMEYQLPDGDDYNAVCSECRNDRGLYMGGA